MEKGKNAQKCKVDNQDCQSDYEYEHACRKLNFADMLPKMDNGFQENEYVAVVYQDAWYPGCVTQSKDKDKAKVKFI